MSSLSLWSVLFVSFPEELLILLITMAAAGYRDVLNFKEKKNIAKLLLAVSLMVVTSAIGRVVLPWVTLNSVLQIIVFYIIVVVIYRPNFFRCLIGLMSSVILIILSESIFGSFIMKLFHITLDQLFVNTFLTFLYSLPDRIIQILAFIIICKRNDISISFEKPSPIEWVAIATYWLMIIYSMFSIESCFKMISNNDFSTILNLILNICIAVVFSSWLTYNIFKMRQKAIIDKKMRNFELHSIRKLLSEGHVKHVIDIIDEELGE